MKYLSNTIKMTQLKYIVQTGITIVKAIQIMKNMVENLEFKRLKSVYHMKSGIVIQIQII